MDDVRSQYSKDISESCFKLDSNIEKQTNLEIDLLKAKSKVEDAHLEITELNRNNLSQINVIDLLKKSLNEKENEFNELNKLYYKTLSENKYLINLNSNERHNLQLKYTELQLKVKS